MMADGRPFLSTRSIPIIVFALLTAAFAVAATMQLGVLVRYGHMSALAERLEKSEKISEPLIHSYALQAADIVTDGICTSDVVMAGATVVLADLDRLDPVADYDRWAAALEAADRYFRHAVSCSPTNGNFWLRLAMVRQAVAERPEEIARLMEQSVRWAPAEADILVGRLVLWNKVGPATLLASKALVQHDLDTLLRYGDSSELAPVIRTVRKNLLPYVHAIVLLLPSDRVELLAKAGVSLSTLQ
ncbi:hypothetical protein EV286_104399 [Rhizobium sp. BK251]|nr:hypothetical protein EV286_104399 [Rhizobium sp. BK251]